jgi:5'-phosphate synthase pdxT subunit
MSAPKPTIGVLALQGAFIEHVAKFLELGVACREVRTADELAQCCALVVPGGESTAMGLLAARTGLVRT